MTKTQSALESLGRLIGSWTTEASHPALPGVTVRGTADIEWLEGNQFLIQRARNDHPDFPDSISIIGFLERGRADQIVDAPQLTMHYYDSRGVFRVYETEIDDKALRFHRRDPGFSQRFTGTFTDGAGAMAGQWQMSEDDAQWQDDLQITYRRRR